MNTLVLHFSHRQQPDQPLVPGVRRIVRHASGAVGLGDASPGTLLLAQFCLDTRGLWLQVANSLGGVHVNGRPVRRMAQLRAGDSVYVEGVEMLVRSQCMGLDQAPPRSDAQASDLAVLRGIGGLHHGRSLPLDRPRTVGRDADADIVIDDVAFAALHARLERHDDRILLRDLGSSEGTCVNGVRVRHCWLEPGDQLVFDAQHRFIVEAPQSPNWVPVVEEPLPLEPEHAQAAADERTRSPRRWPWLLVSAALMAGALSALLLFGAR